MYVKIALQGTSQLWSRRVVSKHKPSSNEWKFRLIQLTMKNCL